eukprot:EG_transcript_32889
MGWTQVQQGLEGLKALKWCTPPNDTKVTTSMAGQGHSLRTGCMGICIVVKRCQSLVNTSPKASVPDQGHFDPRVPDQGHFDPSVPDQGHFDPSIPDQGHFDPSVPDQGHFA